MTTENQIIQTEDLIRRVKTYFEYRNKLPRACSNNNQCNNKFLSNDQSLADLSNLIVTKVNQNKTHSFGIGLSEYPQGSTLTKRACACPSSPNPYTRKNEARNFAEMAIDKWMKAATKWIESGSPNINPEVISRTPLKLGRKVKYFYGNGGN